MEKKIVDETEKTEWLKITEFIIKFQKKRYRNNMKMEKKCFKECFENGDWDEYKKEYEKKEDELPKTCVSFCSPDETITTKYNERWHGGKLCSAQENRIRSLLAR